MAVAIVFATALDGRDWLATGAILFLALALAFGLNRWLLARGRRLAEVMTRGELSAAVDTRLRFLRRFAVSAIVVVGATIAFGLDEIAGSLLTSTAIAAAVIGFAARQVLANSVAGVMLAITQPLRVGDSVCFEDVAGTVEDVRLNYTVLRTASDQRVLIPNERLAGGVLKNDTLVTPTVSPDATVWLPPDADVARAVAAVAEATGGSVSVAESAATGIRLSIGADPVAPGSKAARETELRTAALTRLHTDGLLAGFGTRHENQ
jgi:small-conductance mechanosensitive channel